MFSHTNSIPFWQMRFKTSQIVSKMVICLRWVSNEYEVCEDLIGLVQLDNIISDTIYLVLLFIWV